MRDILILIPKITRGAGEVKRKEVLGFSLSTRRIRRKGLVILPPWFFLKAITPAIKIFCLIKTNYPQPLYKPPINPHHFHDKRLFCPTKPFDYPLIFIKILLQIKMFIGIGQELKVLHKGLFLILTLSQRSSLPRVIENSPTGIVDSQERKFTKGG